MVREPVPSEWKGLEEKSLRILGQLHGTFIVCEAKEGLVLIDQHAAHERILFDRYRLQYTQKSLPINKFLIPHLIEVSAEESLLMGSVLEEFCSVGFEIDALGERTYAIRSMPAVMGHLDPRGVVREILEGLSLAPREEKRIPAIESILLTLACHTAVRGNFSLRKEEIEELVISLTPFSLSATCPHGRPIFFSIHRQELNRQFKRDR